MMDRYFDGMERLLPRLRAQHDALQRAARLVATTILDDGTVYAFGSGHSESVAHEAVRRAGGLYPIQLIMDPAHGRFEQLPGYGAFLVRKYPVAPGDTLIIISNSGKNHEPLDIAVWARDAGAQVIAVTAVEASRQLTADHPAGKRLFELADVVLDNHSAPGDASLPLDGTGIFVGPTSTVAGSILVQAVVVEACALLHQQGFAVPVMKSLNVPEGQEYNKAIEERYSGKFAYLGALLF